MQTTLAILTLLMCALVACSTHQLSLNYSPPPGTVPASPVRASVTVGDFADDRLSGEDRSNTRLGSVWTEFGHLHSQLVSNEPVSALVSRFFTAGLTARGLASDSSKGRIVLSGSIKELRCSTNNWYNKGQVLAGQNRTAAAELQVVLSESDGGRRVFDHVYRASNSESSWPAPHLIWITWERIRALMEKTLRQAVDEALDDPALLNALRLEAPGSTP